MRRLTSAFGFDSNPAWSSDGKRIGYFNGRALRILDAETGSAAAVPNQVQGSGDLYFNPDGRRIWTTSASRPRSPGWTCNRER